MSRFQHPPRQIVGYEGSAPAGHPVVWGAAAVHNLRTNLVQNAALPGGFGISPEEWRELVAQGTATATEVPIPLDPEQEDGPFFTVEMRIDLIDRKPYALLGNDPEFWAVCPGVVGVARGCTKAYYVFKSHRHLDSWIYHMNAGKFLLVPA